MIKLFFSIFIVFSGLALVEDFAAAELAAQYIDNKNLKSEAEVALIQILWRTFESSDREKSINMTQILIENTKNDRIRKEALELSKALN